MQKSRGGSMRRDGLQNGRYAAELPIDRSSVPSRETLIDLILANRLTKGCSHGRSGCQCLLHSH